MTLAVTGESARQLDRSYRDHAAPGGPEPAWCRILGPLQVWVHGGEVQLRGRHRQAVLGLLALQPNAVVQRGAIVDALWREESPATAVTMIHSYVSQLRKLLLAGRDGTGTRLLTVGSGYRLCFNDDELDLLVFSQLTARARQARHGDDLTAAFEFFEQALELWREEPLAGVDLLQDHPAVTALQALRTAAVVDYAEAARTRAQHAKAMPQLRGLAAREPLNERAHACLMTALAASGQQADALEVFGQIRQRLDDQLGVQPGAELAGAHLHVLRGHQAATAAPGQVAVEASAPGDSAPAPGQLPAAVPDFTGRAAEVSRLAEILAPDANVGVPLAVICGLPGAGKTALALRAAHQLRSAFPDGQLWVQLNGTSTQSRHAADALSDVLRALGVHGSVIPATLSAKAAMYRSQLADRKVLVVIDDAGSAEQVRPLIPGTTGSAVIVTSRMQLTELHGARILPLDILGSQEAVGLLAAIVGDKRVSAEPRAAEQLVGTCGRLPLAVRIAGARLAGRPAWPVSLMSDALTDQRRRLDELATGSLSVRASFAMSYQALDDQSRRALCFLGMLGSADLTEWVVGALLGIADPREVINQLADSSLLTPVGPDATGFPRYRLHDLLRDYAAERLTAEYESERHAALTRTLDAWLQLACLADSELPSEPCFPPPRDGRLPGNVPDALARRLTADPIAWFTAERLNILTAIELSCAKGNHHLAARLAAHLAAYQHIQSRWDDWGRIWRTILSAAQEAGDPAAVARAELRLVAAACGRGGHAEAAPAVERCVTAFEQDTDHSGLAAALYWRALCKSSLGFYEDGRLAAVRALELARQLADGQIEVLALVILAMSEANLPGYQDDANKSGAEALAIVRDLGQPAWELEIMRTVAHVAGLTGRHEASIEMCDQAQEYRQKLGVTFGEESWLLLRADADQGLGRYHEAAEALSTALPIFRDRLMGRHQALCLLKLGYAYQAMCDYEQAIASLEESLPIFRELRLPHLEQRALRTLESCQQQQSMASTQTPGPSAQRRCPRTA